MIVLQAAIAAQAVAIVSGDDDLLVLKSIAGISILTVTTFLAHYFPDI
jgi:predicted nucleic acid-binding protein